MVALIIWGVLNLIALVCVVMAQHQYEEWDGIFIYPIVDKWLEFNGIGKIPGRVITWALTIIFLPMLVFYYFVLALLVICVLSIAGILDAIENLSKKRKK